MLRNATNIKDWLDDIFGDDGIKYSETRGLEGTVTVILELSQCADCCQNRTARLGNAASVFRP